MIDCRPKDHQTTSNASSSLHMSIFPRSGQNKSSLHAWEILYVNYGLNDGESKDGNISAESSIFGRKMADQQGSFSVFVPPLTYKNNNNQSNLQRDRDETSWPKPFNLVWIDCFLRQQISLSALYHRSSPKQQTNVDTLVIQLLHTVR